MTDRPPPPVQQGWWPDWLTPKRLAEFAQNVWQLEKSVQGLKQEAAETQARMDEMQRQLAVQAKQLELLTGFIETSLNERIDLKAENAALKALISLKLGPPRIE